MILAEIPDQYQSNLVKDFLWDLDRGNYDYSYWIGLTNQNSVTFRWANSLEEANFTNWYDSKLNETKYVNIILASVYIFIFFYLCGCII